MFLLKDIAVLVSLASMASCNPIDGAPGDVVAQAGLGSIAVAPPSVQLDRLSSAESPSKAAKKVSWDGEAEKLYGQTKDQGKRRYPSPPLPDQHEARFQPKTPNKQEGGVSTSQEQLTTGEIAKSKYAVREIIGRGLNNLAERHPEENGFVRTLSNIFGALNKRQDPAAAAPGSESPPGGMPDSSPTGMDAGNPAAGPVAGTAGAGSPGPAGALAATSGPPDAAGGPAAGGPPVGGPPAGGPPVGGPPAGGPPAGGPPAGGPPAGGPPPGPGSAAPTDGPASNSAPSAGALGSPAPPASDAGAAGGLASPPAPAAGTLGPPPSSLAPGPDAANKPPATAGAPGQPGTPSPPDGLAPQASGSSGSGKPQNGAQPNGSHHHQHNTQQNGEHRHNHNGQDQEGHQHHRDGQKKGQHHHKASQGKGQHHDPQDQNNGATQPKPVQNPAGSQPSNPSAGGSAANPHPAGVPPGGGGSLPQDPAQPPQQPLNIPQPNIPASQPPIGAPFMGLGGIHLQAPPPPMIMPLVLRDGSRRIYTRHNSDDKLRKRKTGSGASHRKRNPIQTRHQFSNAGASTPDQGFGAMAQPLDASFGYKAAGAASTNGVEASTPRDHVTPEPRLTRSKASVKSSISSGEFQIAPKKGEKVKSIDTLKWGGKKGSRKNKKPLVNENHSSRFEIDHEMVKMNRRSAEDRAYLRTREAYLQDVWMKDQLAKRDAYAAPEPYAYAEPEPYPYAVADPEACPNPYACPDSYHWTQ